MGLMDNLEQLANLKTQILILSSFGVAIIVIVVLLIKYRAKVFGIVSLYESLEKIKDNQEISKKNQESMFAQHKELAAKIEKIASETIPNGSNTIRIVNDAVFDIQKSVKKIETKIDARNEIEKACLFECNELGECISANSALCDLFGTTQDQMLGYGWGKFIHEADVDRVFKNWERALNSHSHEIVDYYRIRSGRDRSIKSVEYKNVFKYEDDKLIATFGTVWEKKDKENAIKVLECIHETIQDLKGTPLWDNIQEHIKNKK